MLRSIPSLLAASVLALVVAGCSANEEANCTQPPVQSYPAPQLLMPTPGETNVSPTIGTIQISTQTVDIVGSLTLQAKGGGTLATGAAKLDPKQPNPNTYVWDVKIPALASGTTYTLVWTVQYPGGCLGPAIVHTRSIASFTTS